MSAAVRRKKRRKEPKRGDSNALEAGFSGYGWTLSAALGGGHPRPRSLHHGLPHGLGLRSSGQLFVPRGALRAAQAPTQFLRQAQQRPEHRTQRRFEIALPEALQQDVHQKQRQHEVDDRGRVVLEAMIQSPVRSQGVEAIVFELAALPETSAGFARLIPVDTDRNAYLKRFGDVVIEVLQQLAQPNRTEAEEELRRQVAYVNDQCTWQLRAEQWTRFLKHLNNGAEVVFPAGTGTPL